MSEKRPLTSEEISEIVDGLDPIDWVQMELLPVCRQANDTLSFYEKLKWFGLIFGKNSSNIFLTLQCPR